MILVEQLERSLQWSLGLWLCSFYVTISAGFALLGYWLSVLYSPYLGVWVGALLFVMFTTVITFFALQIVQRVGRG